MKNILITGGAGFVGCNLIERLIKINEDIFIISLDNYSSGSTDNHIKDKRVVYIKGNTWDIKSIKVINEFNPDIVFHFGEFSRIHLSFDLPNNTFWSNTIGTQQILDYCVKKSAKLIYSCSSAVFNDKDSSPIFLIIDNDINAHADWVTRFPIPQDIADNETMEISWKEAYSTGLGGNFNAVYERLPAGEYRFVVEDLSLTGEPLPTGTAISLVVPRVFWKSFWFWGSTAMVLSLIAIVYGRYLIRQKIRLHLVKERMISDERRRIALDLHDDIGTRVSHISLLASHADNTINHKEANKAFGEISAMSRDLIGALSESVWMLNPNNNDLESLVDFLYRLVSELCRLKNIRCRVDAVFITDNQNISYDFRHNVSLAVKECVNNVLKHSHATNLDMKIELIKNLLVIRITDNGIGISATSRHDGLGLISLENRMKSISGNCKFEHVSQGGLRIILTAPVA